MKVIKWLFFFYYYFFFLSNFYGIFSEENPLLSSNPLVSAFLFSRVLNCSIFFSLFLCFFFFSNIFQLPSVIHICYGLIDYKLRFHYNSLRFWFAIHFNYFLLLSLSLSLSKAFYDYLWFLFTICIEIDVKCVWKSSPCIQV